MSDESVVAVIPTVDRPKRVRNAIESAFNQTHSNIEVIVVDDSTDDETAKVVEDLSNSDCEKELTYIRNEDPRGVSVARNQAIERTESDYIAFLDDDDEWDPDKTERQLATFRAGTNSLGLVYAGFRSVDEAGNHLHTKIPKQSGDLYEELLVKDIVGPPSAVTVRRSAIEEVGGFDEEFHHHEDWELYLRLAKRYTFESNTCALTTRTVHENAVSNNIGAAKEHREQLLSSYSAELKKRGLYDKAWASHYRKSGIMACRVGETQKGRWCFLCSLSYHLSVRTIILLGSTLFGKIGFRILRSAKQLMNEKSVT